MRSRTKNSVRGFALDYIPLKSIQLRSASFNKSDKYTSNVGSTYILRFASILRSTPTLGFILAFAVAPILITFLKNLIIGNV